MIEDEPDLLGDERHRPIGRQADDHIVRPEADVIAAPRRLGRRRAIIEARLDPNADPADSTCRLDPADQHGGAVHAAILLEAGGEIGDPHAAALGVGQRRFQDRAVAVIGLRAGGEAFELDIHEPAIFIIQQAAEDRVGIEPGMAVPDMPALPVDQSADDAIADDGEVEIMHFGPTLRPWSAPQPPEAGTHACRPGRRYAGRRCSAPPAQHGWRARQRP